MRYLLIYYGGSMPETPAQQARVMKQWTRWFEKLDAATKLARGCPVIKGGAQVAVYETFNVM